MPELVELKEALQSLHLSPNAVRFYLESYRTGPASIGQIALLCSMDRSSAYLAVEQLKEHGLVTEDLAGTRKKIAAKPPKTVLARLRTETRRFRRQAEAIEESLPALLASYAANEAKPILQFFSGVPGLHQVTDDVLEQAEGEILLLTNQATEKDVFSKADHEAFIATRLQRGISIRVLAANVPDAYELQKRDKYCLRETRVVDGEPFTSETYIYADTVAMINFNREVMGFTVRSKEFAESQRWMFEQLWKHYGEDHA